MKAAHLRIGDIASPIDEFLPQKVAALENGTVHLAWRQYPENENEIIPVQLNFNFFESLAIDIKPLLVENGFRILGKQGRNFKLLFRMNDFSPEIDLSYVHELQNLYLLITGSDLIN
jgi:hypothetical protein